MDSKSLLRASGLYFILSLVTVVVCSILVTLSSSYIAARVLAALFVIALAIWESYSARKTQENYPKLLVYFVSTFSVLISIFWFFVKNSFFEESAYLDKFVLVFIFSFAFNCLASMNWRHISKVSIFPILSTSKFEVTNELNMYFVISVIDSIVLSLCVSSGSDTAGSVAGGIAKFSVIAWFISGLVGALFGVFIVSSVGGSSEFSLSINN